MCQLYTRKRKSLTTEASLVMAEARKRAKGLSPPREDIEAFVLRRSSSDKSFLWQIRLFGGVVLQTSDVYYSTLEAAQDAGVLAQISYSRDLGSSPTSSISR